MRWKQAEDWLAQQGFIENVNYTYQQSVALKSIDETASLSNQARTLEPINQEWVANYARRMQAGSEPPASLAMRQPNGKLMILDGNHRYLAFKRVKAPAMDAYVLNRIEDVAVLRRIVATANSALVGRGASMQDLIDHAASVAVESNKSIVSVAEMYNVSEAALRYEVRNREVAVRLMGLGVDPSKLGAAVRNRLADVHNDMALKTLAKLCIDLGLSRKDIHNLVTDLRQERSEAGMLVMIQKFRERPDIMRRVQQTPKGTKARIQDAKRRRLFAGMSNLTSLLKANGSRTALELSADEDFVKARQAAIELVGLLRQGLVF